MNQTFVFNPSFMFAWSNTCIKQILIDLCDEGISSTVLILINMSKRLSIYENAPIGK